MPTTFSQNHHDPEQEPKAPPRIPLSSIIWFPLSLLIGAGIVFAAKFGHERAAAELETIPNPTSGNETLSDPFVFDPGDDPLVLALEQNAIRDHLSAPPGSPGSGTVVESEPLLLRIVQREGNLALVLVVEGRLENQRFWAKAERLLAAKRAAEQAGKD